MILQLLVDRFMQALVNPNDLSGFVQNQRIGGEDSVGVIRFAILLRHADVFRVNDFGLHLSPDLKVLQRFDRGLVR